MTRDHLHIRGEYALSCYIDPGYKGSPPHTWRILPFTSVRSWRIRIISTYVENTILAMILAHLVQDHLHIRGEYSWVRLDSGVNSGSPPHTWRIQLFSNHLHLLTRITSTYVENTAKMSKRLRKDTGSPPHTWRIQFEAELYEQVDRITSTYVENTSCSNDNKHKS